MAFKANGVAVCAWLLGHVTALFFNGCWLWFGFLGWLGLLGFLGARLGGRTVLANVEIDETVGGDVLSSDGIHALGALAALASLGFRWTSADTLDINVALGVAGESIMGVNGERCGASRNADGKTIVIDTLTLGTITRSHNIAVASFPVEPSTAHLQDQRKAKLV